MGGELGIEAKIALTAIGARGVKYDVIITIYPIAVVFASNRMVYIHIICRSWMGEELEMELILLTAYMGMAVGVLKGLTNCGRSLVTIETRLIG